MILIRSLITNIELVASCWFVSLHVMSITVANLGDNRAVVRIFIALLREGFHLTLPRKILWNGVKYCGSSSHDRHTASHSTVSLSRVLFLRLLLMRHLFPWKPFRAAVTWNSTKRWQQ